MSLICSVVGARPNFTENGASDFGGSTAGHELKTNRSMPAVEPRNHWRDFHKFGRAPTTLQIKLICPLRYVPSNVRLFFAIRMSLPPAARSRREFDAVTGPRLQCADRINQARYMAWFHDNTCRMFAHNIGRSTFSDQRRRAGQSPSPDIAWMEQLPVYTFSMGTSTISAAATRAELPSPAAGQKEEIF